MSAQQMIMHRPQAYETATEIEMMERLLPLHQARILELGCGGARITRQLAEHYPESQFTATEVDRIQHEKNLAQAVPTNLSFRLGGAESIDAEAESFDIVWMLKSLHHVPGELMSSAMEEIRRVLKPGGLGYFSEPVYAGEFNALMSLIHDEKRVRTLAFEAIRGVVEEGRMRLVGEYFFNVPGRYLNWQAFEDRFLNITHTELFIDAQRYATIKQAFQVHLGPQGAEFMKPHRVDLLQKPVV
ncbi:MAG: class I SAM-dependent methyltransferase [Candidatus Thiodiazotropha sp.]